MEETNNLEKHAIAGRVQPLVRPRRYSHEVEVKASHAIRALAQLYVVAPKGDPLETASERAAQEVWAIINRAAERCDSPAGKQDDNTQVDDERLAHSGQVQ